MRMESCTGALRYTLLVMPQANRLKLPSASARQQAQSRESWNRDRSLIDAQFFTFGYTGRKTEEIVECLLLNGVRTLIDIRQNPVSMYRPDLSKSNLARLIESRGMNYVHVPELGVPRDIRAKAIEANTRDVIWDWYDRAVADKFTKNLHWLLNAVEAPFAFMCVEIDPVECHRHRLCLALERQGLVGFDL